MDFLHKIDDFEAKIPKNSRLRRAFLERSIFKVQGGENRLKILQIRTFDFGTIRIIPPCFGGSKNKGGIIPTIRVDLGDESTKN